MTAWQLALDHEDGALFGAVVEHLLRDDPRSEVAERAAAPTPSRVSLRQAIMPSRVTK